MTVSWIRLCLDDCSVICKVTLCYVLHQTYSEFWHIQHSVFQVYVDIFKHTRRYCGIFTHIETLWRHNQAFSAIFSTLCNPRRFVLALAYLESEAYLKPCETLTRHIPNSAVKHYSAVFRNIQNLVQRLHTQKPGTLGILEYSKPFHNCIPMHFQNPAILTKINEDSDIFKARHKLRTVSKFMI